MRLQNGTLVTGIVVVLLATVAAAFAVVDYTPVAKYDFDTGRTDVMGNFSDAELGAGTQLLNGNLVIGNTITDYANLPADLLNGTTDFTMTIRFMIDSFQSIGNTLIHVLDLASSEQTQIEIVIDHGTLQWNMFGNWHYISNKIDEGTWYEMEFMRTGSNLLIYLNDSLIQDETVSPATLAVSGGTVVSTILSGITLGQDIDTSSGPFENNESLNGKIDYIVFYHEAPVPTALESFGDIKAMFR